MSIPVEKTNDLMPASGGLNEGLAAIGSNVELAARLMSKEKQVKCSVIHRFGPGICIREVSMPAGTLSIGHHQNFEHVNFMLKGRVTMLNDDGSTSELDATEEPIFFVGKPGRKVGFIHEDMVWQNIYATDKTDVDAIELEFVTKTDEWKLSLEQAEGFNKLQYMPDNEDYKDVIEEFGVTEEIARAQTKNTLDMIELPFGTWKIKASKSNIEGKGLIATAEIDAGELIAPSQINGKYTIAGLYTNHAKEPNAKMVKRDNGDIDLVAMRKIEGCRGGIDGEEITIDYRQKLLLPMNTQEDI